MGSSGGIRTVRLRRGGRHGAPRRSCCWSTRGPPSRGGDRRAGNHSERRQLRVLAATSQTPVEGVSGPVLDALADPPQSPGGDPPAPAPSASMALFLQASRIGLRLQPSDACDVGGARSPAPLPRMSATPSGRVPLDAVRAWGFSDADRTSETDPASLRSWPVGSDVPTGCFAVPSARTPLNKAF